ncbi:protein translocase subunit SecD [Streptomyces spiroverticillatus]|uniref:Protein translocase subunit SecD n=1 Tax=Streptomyces finlayi TaxID=67296 RepID=A0A918X0H5_9ACTN|nr:protein translocase subunit SecD [Streptomyces finlayi]GHA38126.1 protein translocase subunit SecD [Streptomyces spiroverticillatus]GHD00509.1 protein translocase subunit SecD [Streptomyces finlayi]
MAAPKKGRKVSGAPGRPGRALALITIVILALAGGMFASGHTTPRLGIDLAGGTSITLKAQNEPGQPNAINKTNMDTAVAIMERRVNGMGVSESEVQTQGTDNIIVNIPKGTNSKQAREQVGTTAKLYFRQVLAQTQGTPLPDPGKTPKPDPTSTKKPDEAKDPKDKDGKDKDSKDKKSSPTPDPTKTSQGRAVTDALKAPTPTPTPGASKTPDPKTTPPAQDPATAKLEKAFAALDCTKPEQREKAGDGIKPSEPTIACGKSITGKVWDGKSWDKFILGPAELEGTDVKKASGTFDTQRALWKVDMEFTKEGSDKFAKTTGKLMKLQQPLNQFGIVLDGNVVSAPSVSTVLSGNAEITGSFTQETAQELGNILSYGSLPLTFKEETVTTVTPALGSDQLEAGLIAGAIGLALVVIYLVLYYRGLSFVALLSLLVSGILTYTIMALLGPAIGFALNLPAVCGAIVAIGITADSFIVYFERIRDEIRDGRTLRPAVERAWPRARRTILVSDFVSLLSAVVLYIVTVGKVQGFAFTLGLTTLLDVVVVFLFTKPLMTLLASKTKFFGNGHKWSGLDPKRLGVQPPLRRTRRSVVPTEPKEA